MMTKISTVHFEAAHVMKQMDLFNVNAGASEPSVRTNPAKRMRVERTPRYKRIADNVLKLPYGGRRSNPPKPGHHRVVYFHSKLFAAFTREAARNVGTARIPDQPKRRAYWHQRFANELAAMGFGPEVIERQTSIFAAALLSEQRRQIILKILSDQRGDAA